GHHDGVHHPGELVPYPVVGEEEDGRRSGHRSAHQRSSDRERSVADATASMKAERTARASSVRMPAAVVPAGDVTMARSASRSCPLSAIKGAVPSTVCTTSP